MQRAATHDQVEIEDPELETGFQGDAGAFVNTEDTEAAQRAAREAMQQQFDLENDGFRAETDMPPFVPKIKDIEVACLFRDALKTATLESTLEPLPAEVLERIINPVKEYVRLGSEDRDLRLSLEIFLAVQNASEASYELVRQAVMRAFPGSSILSYHLARKTIADITGVVPIYRDCCKNSCAAFTGPWASLSSCPTCGEDRYEKDGVTPRQTFLTIPLAPQLQAQWRTPEGAHAMRYRERFTKKLFDELRAQDGERGNIPFTDFLDSDAYIQEVSKNHIASHDSVVLLSLDGAQLYAHKASDYWIGSWITLNQSPDSRYQRNGLRPALIIPGPNKPKHLDSFLFPTLWHLAAIQKEGVKIWDAENNTVFVDRPFFAFATADGPGSAAMSGFVGHQGKMHCRAYCPIRGRRRSGDKAYYPARLKPGSDDYNVPGCTHPDVDLDELLESFTPDEAASRYKKNLDILCRATGSNDFKAKRLQTGICKPSIFSGLPAHKTLGVPGMFPLDIMHLPCLNIPDLLFPLWRGTFDYNKDTDDRKTWDWAVLVGKQWIDYGAEVASIRSYVPGFFSRPPRNIAQKYSSGYKASEHMLNLYGYGPCLLFGVLPDVYWENLCHLVRGFRIMMQQVISPEELVEAHTQFSLFSTGFEELYYQRREDRLHFVRPSIHAPSHFPYETQRAGPGLIYSQWMIECVIGLMGAEVRQPAKAFANLAQRALLQCQTSALKAIIPDLRGPSEPGKLPRGAIDIGNGYLLLRKRERTPHSVRSCEKNVLQQFFASIGQVVSEDKVKVRRWARLQLPNGHKARSRWGENSDIDRNRRARCVIVRPSISWYYLQNRFSLKHNSVLMAGVPSRLPRCCTTFSQMRP